MTAGSTRACKAKGRKLQNYVTERLRKLLGFGDSDIKPSLMSEQGMDIKLSSRVRVIFGYAIECKNQERINIWAALSQAETNAAKEHLKPVLVIKRNRSKIYAVVELNEFLDLTITKKTTGELKHGD